MHEIVGRAVGDTSPLMEAGISSLEMVSLHHSLADAFKQVSINNSAIFNYPTIHDLATYVQGEQEALAGKVSMHAEETGVEWQKLNSRSNGRPVFLVGGVLGTAEGTFGKLAHSLTSPVYALIPDLSSPGCVSIESLATELVRALRRIQPEGRCLVGGLSFGAVLALEMACQLEEQEEVEALILLDPRHTPPFSLPENPAKFEQLVAAYTPKVTIHSRTVLVQAALPDFSRLSALLKEASRSFQSDLEVEANCSRWCYRVGKFKCADHHFRFLNQSHLEIARHLTGLPVSWQLGHSGREETDSDQVAVIAMSCRLPGGVSSPDDFWEMLLEGRDCVARAPMSRLDMDEDVYVPQQGVSGKSYTDRAAFIEDAERFDHEFFSISRAEALLMDPQQRLMLEVAYEAFNQAGYDRARLKRLSAGVFIGQANYDWLSNKSKYLIMLHLLLGYFFKFSKTF